MELAMSPFAQFAISCLLVASLSATSISQEPEEHVHAAPVSEEGLGRAHMDISCARTVVPSLTVR